MIDRYTMPEMGELWHEDAVFECWLEVEIAHCKALAEAVLIPRNELSIIQKKASIDVKRIREIEKTTNHDMIAFLESLAEKVGPASRYIHLGLTSTDVVDTAQALTLKKAFAILENDLEKLLSALRDRALLHKDLICIGRTHGMHAEPTIFGLKFAVWWDEMNRNRERLLSAKSRILVGKLSGAVGTYSETTPELEARALSFLGLKRAGTATQVIQRDLHAELLSALAILAGTLDKIAVEFRHLQRSEVGETAEPFRKGQKGSSAMPHKRNPILCERISGLARIVRNNAGAGFENQILWHERDISHSSAERIILADSFILIDYMLQKMTQIINGLSVFPERISKNLEKSNELVFSSRILTELMRRGVERKIAYEWIQTASMKVLNEGGTLSERLNEITFPEGKLPISEIELNNLFNFDWLKKSIEEIYRRIGLIR